MPRLRRRLAGQAFALAADPRLLDQAIRPRRAYRREEIAPETFADFLADLSGMAMSAPTSRCRTRRRRWRCRSRTIARARSARPTRFGSTAAGCVRPTPTSRASPPISTLRCRAGTKRADDAVVLGAGGSARAVVYGLIERGIGKIHMVNRTFDRAEELRRRFGARGAARAMERAAASAHPHGPLGQHDVARHDRPAAARHRSRAAAARCRGGRPGLRAAGNGVARGGPRARFRHRRRTGHAAAPGGAGVSAVVRRAAGSRELRAVVEADWRTGSWLETDLVK